MADKERAKLILTEILRLFGGQVPSKSHLFKAFYFAHLYYAKEAPDYLSDWAIVRMPLGPGIDRADELIHDLVSEGMVEVQRVQVGPYQPFQFRLLKNERPAQLSLEAIEAIRRAVEFTKDKTASELTELTHEYSHSWSEARDGEELNIYVDLLSEGDYQRESQAAAKLADAIKDMWE